MVRRSAPWLAAAFLALAALLAPPPQPASGTPAATDPLWLRAASGPFRPLAADRLWLRAARRGEGTGTPAGPALLRRLRAVMALDPAFRPALRYAATYYATVAGDLSAAHALCDEALRFRPGAAYPYVLKAVLELGYAPAPDRAAIRRWLDRARTNGARAPWLEHLRHRLAEQAP